MPLFFYRMPILNKFHQTPKAEADDEKTVPTAAANKNVTPSVKKAVTQSVTDADPKDNRRCVVTSSRSLQPPEREPSHKKQKRHREHPYAQKIDAKIDKLLSLLQGIYELADNDLIVAEVKVV